MVKRKVKITCILLVIVLMFFSSCVKSEVENITIEKSEEIATKNEIIIKGTPSQFELDQELISKIRDEYYSMDYTPITSISQPVYNYFDGESYNIEKNYGPINKVLVENNDEKRKNKLVLTFDCAYAGDYTIQILDVLDQYNIKASFFATLGFIKEHPDMVIEIVARGHDFGGHSTNHSHYNELSDEEVIRDVIESEAYIKKTFGLDMCFFRNPYGEFNERNVKLLQEMGYYDVNWAFDSLDWRNEGVESIIQRVLYNEFFQGDIMLFHVSGIYTAVTLPSIIEYARALNFDFAPLSEMIYTDNFIVDKGKQKFVGKGVRQCVKDKGNIERIFVDTNSLDKPIINREELKLEKEKVINKSFRLLDTLSFGSWRTESENVDKMKYTIIDQDDKLITIMANNIIEAIPYDYRLETTWENSFIRKWLNEYFYDKSFSDIEKDCIVEYEDNIEKTKDKVTIPSIKDFDNKTFKKCIINGASASKKLFAKYNNKNIFYGPLNYMWLKERFYITRSTGHKYKYEYMTKEIKDPKLSFRPILRLDREKYLNYITNNEEKNDLTVDNFKDFNEYIEDNYQKDADKFYNEHIEYIDNIKEEKTIYLTFDDGPSSITGEILDVLKDENVKASFFICNYGNSGKKILQRIIDEGHTLGLHGHSHEFNEIYVDKDTFFVNIDSLSKKVENDLGVTPRYFRFPGGSSNEISINENNADYIMTELIKYMTDKGYRYFDWTLASGDVDVPMKNPQEIYDTVINNIKDDINVVLMHDSNSHQNTIAALKLIITTLKEKGYIFKSIDNNTIPYHHMISN